MPHANSLAVYGGTFSPIHRGHIEVARFLQETFKFDEFKFLPNQSPVLDKSASAPMKHRLAMLKLALAPYPQFSIDQRELERPTPSYMVDTLQSLTADYGSDTSITVIIGMDNFQQFHRWRDWKTILTLCNLIVLERPNIDNKLNPLLKDLIEKGEMRIMTHPRDLHSGHGGVYYCDAGSYDISSTKIRQLIQEGQSDASYLRKNVPTDVLSYIQKHNLFRPS
jgi:nicotinate-nucleotide adenylyltransferase